MAHRKLTPFRKKYLNFKTAEKRRKLKLDAITYKGGKCVKCGYDKCPAALVFHHLDPSQKDFGIANKGRTFKSFEKMIPELDKCILLCSNCHNELHAEEDERARSSKLEEIEKEKRSLQPSVDAICDMCFLPIMVFVSDKKQNKFCSIECKNNFFLHKDWPSHDEFQHLKLNFSAKEIAEKLNKPLSSTYDRMKKMQFALTQSQQLLLKGFIENKEHNIEVDARREIKEAISWRTMKKRIRSFNHRNDPDYTALLQRNLIEEVDNDFFEMTDYGYSVLRNLSISFVKFSGSPLKNIQNYRYGRNIIVDIFGHKYESLTIYMSDGLVSFNQTVSQDQADEIYEKVINGNLDLEHWLLWNKMECEVPNAKYKPGVIKYQMFNTIHYLDNPVVFLLKNTYDPNLGSINS